MKHAEWAEEYLREKHRAIAKAIAKSMGGWSYVVVNTDQGLRLIRLPHPPQPTKDRHIDNIRNKPIPRWADRQSYIRQ